MKRPGYLKNRKVPRARKQRFGFAGTGYISPMPGPPIEGANPPPGQMIPLDYAKNKITGRPYLQDSRCPEGEKMVKHEQRVPCQFPDDCDPGETELEIEWECEDDPEFMETPPPAAPAAKLAAKAEKAEAAEAEVEEAQQMAPASSAPMAPSPRAEIGPATAEEAQEEEISKLVEAHEDGSVVSPLVIRSMEPSEPTGLPPTTNVTPRRLGIIGWIKLILFGDQSSDGLEGLSDSKVVIPTIVSGLAVAGIYYWWKQNQRPKRRR